MKKMYKLQIQQIDPLRRTAVLVGVIPFIDLIEHVRFTFRRDQDDDTDCLYQRRTEPERIKNIAKYIEDTLMSANDRLPVFPTSIILAADNEDIDFDLAKPDDVVTLNSLQKDMLIVDGQHRLAGMESLYNRVKQTVTLFGSTRDEYICDMLKKYNFNCSLLINYDLWDQARIFASVNFNQRKVNKSLFYDIYGFFPPEVGAATISRQNEIYLAHKLVEYLNKNETSPFYGFVKMLGTGKGYVSQAFMVEQLVKLMRPSGIWYDVVEDIKSEHRRGLQNFAMAELMAYLGAIKNTFREFWPNDDTEKVSVLCKTTGIGAIFRFMEVLHNNISNDRIERLMVSPSEPDNLVEMYKYFLKNIKRLKPYGAELFSPDSKVGHFNGTGGSGLQAKLYRRIYNLWLGIEN